jgi:urea transporter
MENTAGRFGRFTHGLATYIMTIRSTMRQFRSLQRVSGMNGNGSERFTSYRYNFHRKRVRVVESFISSGSFSVATTPPPPQPPSNEDDMSKQKVTPIQAIIDSSTKGVGQVLFLNSKSSGQILLASLAIGDPFVAVLATLGTVTASTTAKYVALPSRDTLENGLYSYNGCLIGCASSVFLSSTYTTTGAFVLASTALTVSGAASATIVTAIINKVCPPMPQWTFAFNFVMLTALLRIQPLAPKNPTSTTMGEMIDVNSSSAASTMDILLSPMTGLSQIFVVESVWTGAGILAAIASYSPGLAVHALMGSSIGCMMGTFVYAVPIGDVAAGLWGYNAALTSLGVGTFFVSSKQTNALSIAGAIATSAVFGAMQPMFTATPCLTLPFCITMSACWLLGTPSSQQSTAVIPGLILARDPHSPEKNTL